MLVETDTCVKGRSFWAGGRSVALGQIVWDSYANLSGSCTSMGI